MSSKAGSVLAGYQGWACRRAVMRAGLWPCRAYQVMIRVQVSRANGTMRSTARRVRLRFRLRFPVAGARCPQSWSSSPASSSPLT